MIYDYRCSAGHRFALNHSMGDFTPRRCECGAEAKIQVTRTPAVRIRKVFDHRYMPGLARFRGDPEAFVDGPRALRRALDKAKREGGHVVDPHDALAAHPAESLEAPSLGDAYLEAKADGFRLEGED